ncbi:AAA family ATPase [Ramlibacter sp. PS4R-6]|uniref:AAA family ATPase n=1 Tax=Ramlibacter sp. PS4R-6 TaxID=3133438 RepID=UPI003098B6F3
MEPKDQDDKVDSDSHAADAIRITSISIGKLFGSYDYELKLAAPHIGEQVRILYGENGLGKTNILAILFHLLSPHERRNHRNSLAKIKFQSVLVSLSNGIQVSARRPEGKLDGGFRCEVTTKRGLRLLGGWNFVLEGETPKPEIAEFLHNASPETLRLLEDATPSKSSKARSKALTATRKSELVAQQVALNELVLRYFKSETNPLMGEQPFLQALAASVPPVYFLSADRIFSSDKIERDEGTADTDLRPGRMSTELLLTKGRERTLSRAIKAASDALSTRAVTATRFGSSTMHSIYAGLIERLASRHATRETLATPVDQLVSTLEGLQGQYDRFSTYGLSSSLNAVSIIKNLRAVKSAEREVASDILQPYVDSLTEQAKSLEDAYGPIHRLVSTINQFLYDKQVGFTLGRGLYVANGRGEVLAPKDLSSGEQQLLLLFCHITIAHNTGGIFIVDEPELSLNIKWQRRLVRSLLELDTHRNLQFILASHSMEVITAFRDEVVVLEEAKNG